MKDHDHTKHARTFLLFGGSVLALALALTAVLVFAGSKDRGEVMAPGPNFYTPNNSVSDFVGYSKDTYKKDSYETR